MWTLDDALSFLLEGDLTILDGEREESLDQIDPNLRDAMVLVMLNQPKVRTCDNWLMKAHCELFSQNSCQERLKKLVLMRLMTDVGLPVWIFMVCEIFEHKGWEIPAPWIGILRSSLELSGHSSPRTDSMAFYAKGWLRDWDERNKQIIG